MRWFEPQLGHQLSCLRLSISLAMQVLGLYIKITYVLIASLFILHCKTAMTSLKVTLLIILEI
jgi:hypothetical protein